MATMIMGLTAAATAAATTAGTALTAAATTASTALAGGSTLATLLQGGATVLGIASSLQSSAADADAAEAAAIDADLEQANETLKGIERRSSIKRALGDALGQQDVAYAASGLDLSFGTAAQARSDALRESDLALAVASGTELSRGARLQQRAANYRSQSKRIRRAGMIGAFAQMAGLGRDIAARG